MNLRLLSTVLLTSSFLPCSFASTPRPWIGTVLSGASFSVNQVTANGTATLFDGDRLATTGAATRIHLSDGVELNLFAHSSAVIYSSHIELTAGTLAVTGAQEFPINAAGFVVRPSSPQSMVEVQLAANHVNVSSAAGGASVFGSRAMTLDKVPSGTTLALTSDVVATGLVNQIYLLGVLTQSNDRFLIRDRYTNVVSELTGNIPPKTVDKLVTIRGEIISNKSSIPNVDHIVQVSKLALSEATLAMPCLLDGAGGIAARIVVEGILSKTQNHFLVTGDDRKVYEVLGNVNNTEVGQRFKSPALVLDHHQPISPARKVVYAEHRDFVLAASPCAGLATAGGAISTGLIALPKNEPAQPKLPISF